MGASHHFLRIRRKLQNSRRINNFAFTLELFFVISRRWPGRSRLPISTCICPKCNFDSTLSKDSLQPTERGNHEEENKR